MHSESLRGGSIDSALVNPARRHAIRAGVLAATGAVLWAEPTLKGLSRRPAYASVTSTPLTATSGADTTLPTSGQTLDRRVTSDGFSFVDLVYADLGDGTYTITAVHETPGCECVIDGVGVSNITGRDPDGNVLQTTGAVFGGVLEFELVPGAFVINVNWSGLTITCT